MRLNVTCPQCLQTAHGICLVIIGSERQLDPLRVSGDGIATDDGCGYPSPYFHLHYLHGPGRSSPVYMSFMERKGWQVQFLEADLKTPLLRKLHFASVDKIIELVERAGGFRDQESRLMLDQGIAMGRGGVFLSLTEEQYAKLKSR